MMISCSFHVAFIFKNVLFDLMTLFPCPESSELDQKLLVPIGFSIASLNKVKFNRSKYLR